MNFNETRTLWVSVGCALLAVFLLFSWSEEQKNSLTKRYGTAKPVVIADKDIAELTPIDDSMLKTVSRPVDFIEPSAISNVEQAVGQLAAAPIKKGEQILDTKLLLPSKVTGLSMEVTPGKRAIPIPIDDLRGVSRLIKPGDRIDIIAAIDVGSGVNQRKEVRTILQDVIVLATGTNIANQVPISVEEGRNGTFSIENLKLDTKFTTVTVEVKPDEAQNLVYIISTAPGGLFVSLRNPVDRVLNQMSTSSVDQVMGRPTFRLPSSMPGMPPGMPGSAPAVAPPVTRPAAPPAAPAQPRRPKRDAGGFEEV